MTSSNAAAIHKARSLLQKLRVSQAMDGKPLVALPTALHALQLDLDGFARQNLRGKYPNRVRNFCERPRKFTE